MKIFKIGQVFDWQRFFSHLMKEVRWTLVWILWRSRGEIIPNTDDYFGIPYFSPSRCCTHKFWHALHNDQVLLVHNPLGWGSRCIFFKGGSKIGLKFSVSVPITLGVHCTMIKIMKLCHIACHVVCMITNMHILGVLQPKNFWEHKRQNLVGFCTTFDFDR